MSAQVGKADFQVTPVIIKSGGDPTGGNEDEAVDSVPVSINLENKAFESSLKDDRWHSALSTVTAGIASLTIDDGGTSVGPFTASSESEALITLQVFYGSDILMISEEGLARPHRTKVAINSATRFKVQKHGARKDQWLDSVASFPAANPRVLFTQGEHVLTDYQCGTNDVSLLLGLDWNETGG